MAAMYCDLCDVEMRRLTRERVAYTPNDENYRVAWSKTPKLLPVLRKEVVMRCPECGDETELTAE